MERVLDEEKAKHGVRKHCGEEAVVGKRCGQSPFSLLTFQTHTHTRSRRFIKIRIFSLEQNIVLPKTSGIHHTWMQMVGEVILKFEISEGRQTQMSDSGQRGNKEKLEKRVYLLGNFARCRQYFSLDQTTIAERTQKTILPLNSNNNKATKAAHCVWGCFPKPGTRLYLLYQLLLFDFYRSLGLLLCTSL